MATENLVRQMTDIAPQGEYHLYTDLRKVLGSVEACRTAQVSGDVSTTGVSSDANERLAHRKDIVEIAAMRGQEERYLDYLASVASDDTYSVNLHNDGRATIGISSWSNPDELSVARLNIEASENKKSELVVHLHSAANLLVQMVFNIRSNAQLSVVLLQDDLDTKNILTRSTISVAQGAQLQFHVVNLQPQTVRNEAEVEIIGEGANVSLGGLYTSDSVKHSHVDNVTTIRHRVGHSTSYQLFKGVAQPEAQISFSGLVVVAPDAQKTEARQTNRHMLAAKGAHAYAKPQLEIYADDVKCSHGATTGQIDASQLFYMQQRGIDEATARQLLSAAFLAEVVDQISMTDIREEILQRLTNAEQ